MKKISGVEWLSHEGYFWYANIGTDWLVSGEQTGKYLLKLFAKIDTILLGQVIYDMFAAYWLKPNPSDPNPKELIEFMNKSQKLFFQSL